MSSKMPAFKEMEDGEGLDHFHQRCVVPTPKETSSRNEEIDAFVRFLQAWFKKAPFSAAKVLKGGSLGKGTAVRDSADIDLVVILNGILSVEDLKAHRSDFLEKLDDEVNRYSWKTEITKRSSSKFSLTYSLNGQDVDVLPAFDYLRAYGSKEAVYDKMRHTAGKEVSLAIQFSASLAPLQIDFVKAQPEQVKRVIRLLKFWKKKNDVDIRSYTLELLTIYEASTGTTSTDSLFSDVLTRLFNCHTLQVAFNDNYKSADYTSTLPVPYVLDPANPYMNTMHGRDLDNISKKAKSMLDRLNHTACRTSHVGDREQE